MLTKPIYLCLTQQQLAAIGELIAQWAFFETEVAFTLTALLTVAEGHQKIPLPFKDRMALLRKLIRTVFKDESVVEKYLEIEKVAQNMHLTRSIFAHGRILGDPKKETNKICVEHHRHRKGTWTVHPANISVRSLRIISRAVSWLSSSLLTLNEKHLPVSPTSLPCTFPLRHVVDGPRYRRGHIHRSTRYIRLRSSQA